MERPRNLGIKEYLSSGDCILKQGVLFVPGALRGALYDINTGRVYSVNQSACQILTGNLQNVEFWDNLETIGLVSKDKTEHQSILPELLQKPELQFVWFELISDDCNESCVHCYADSMPPTHRKTLGLPTRGFIPLEVSADTERRKTKLTAEDWKVLIKDAHSLGCRTCQFIGGEPFLYKGENGERVLDMAEYTISQGYDFVEIFTNATMLTPDKVERIKNLGLHIAVSLYSKDPEIHDKITNTLGSFNKTVGALKLLKEAGIPTRVETVLMRHNEKTVEETQEFVEEMGFSHKHADVLRPKGRGDNPAVMPSKESVIRYGLMTSPNFSADKETLSRYLSGHSCLLGKITITDSGDILPCIFSRNLSVGSVKNNSLQEIVVGQKLETVWRNTKDQVLVCQDCEYRYVCFDCRPLSEGVNQGKGEYLSAPYPRCTYNPYTGDWAKGVWRINDDGNPYYDESLRPIIEEVLSTQKVVSFQPSGH
ncbi:radical SAM protein [Candidatus Roizmanbacteria bacterium]|nr:radical SAM protein [Candidatus Roizmanbacteria bacterium]